jgi:hypothetical protein
MAQLTKVLPEAPSQRRSVPPRDPTDLGPR